MLEFRTEALPSENEIKLRLWFKSTEHHLLIRVLESNLRIQCVKSINSALSAGESPGKSIVSDDHMMKAQRLQTVLNVLYELENQAGPYETAAVT